MTFAEWLRTDVAREVASQVSKAATGAPFDLPGERASLVLSFAAQLNDAYETSLTLRDEINPLSIASRHVIDKYDDDGNRRD